MQWKNIEIPVNTEELLTAQVFFISIKDQIDKEFDVFFKDAQTQAVAAENIIKTPFDKDPAALSDDLDNCIQHSYAIGQLVADAQSFLQVYEILHYTPKSKEYADPDRKKFTEIKILKQRNLLSKLKVIEEKIDKKVSVGQSIFRYETARYVKEQA